MPPTTFVKLVDRNVNLVFLTQVIGEINLLRCLVVGTFHGLAVGFQASRSLVTLSRELST